MDPSTTWPFPGILCWLEAEVHATALALPVPSLFFLSDSLSFPVSSSHLLPARPFSHPSSPQHSCCLAHSIYSGIFRVITIKLLKGDNPAEEARLTVSPILSLAWCSPNPPEASCSPLPCLPRPTSSAPAGNETELLTEGKLSGRSHRSSFCLSSGTGFGEEKAMGQ